MWFIDDEDRGRETVEASTVHDLDQSRRLDCSALAIGGALRRGAHHDWGGAGWRSQYRVNGPVGQWDKGPIRRTASTRTRHLVPARTAPSASGRAPVAQSFRYDRGVT